MFSFQRPGLEGGCCRLLQAAGLLRGIFPTVGLGFQIIPYICKSVKSRISFLQEFCHSKGPKLKDFAVFPLLAQGGVGTTTVKDIL